MACTPANLDIVTTFSKLVHLNIDCIIANNVEEKKNWTCGGGSLVFILLGVLQQAGSVLCSRVVLGVVQPALSVVLHPVGSMAVAQQEALGCLSSQQQSGS